LLHPHSIHRALPSSPTRRSSDLCRVQSPIVASLPLLIKAHLALVHQKRRESVMFLFASSVCCKNRSRDGFGFGEEEERYVHQLIHFRERRRNLYLKTDGTNGTRKKKVKT